MCVPDLKEITEIIFELLSKQIKTYGSTTQVNPVYSQLLSEDTTKIMTLVDDQ